jgi:hypothetical protein
MRSSLYAALLCLSTAAMAEVTSFRADVLAQAPRGGPAAPARASPRWTVRADPTRRTRAGLRQSGRRPVGEERATPAERRLGQSVQADRRQGGQVGGVWR